MAPQARVLMVEDHAEIAELYQLKLQLDGYRVALAANGLVGLELARSLMPDLILLDVHLPELDGLQMLSALREDKSTRELPVVVFSDDDTPSLIQEARRLNVAGYLLKAHLVPSRLSRAVAEVLRNHQLESPAEDSGVKQAS